MIALEPVRVLHVFGGLNKGGAESRTMDIYRTIDRDRVQFDFMVHTKEKGLFEPEILKLGGRVYREVPRFRIINFFSYVKAWERFFKRHKYDIVHIHMLNVSVPLLFISKKMGVRVRVCHARSASGSSLPRRIYTYVTRPWVRALSTHRFAVSDKAGKFFFHFNYKVVNNAINARSFRYNPDKRQILRESLGIGNNFAIGHTGRLHVSKNHLFLIDIFARLYEQNPKTCLILAGDGGLCTQIQEKITKMGLSDKIFLLGIRNDIPDLLSAFDIFLMPSLYEGFPGAALEAQSAGLPCLLSDTITPEVKIIDELVDFLPIDKGTEPWVNEVLKHSEAPIPRRDTFEEVKDAGFDIEGVAKWYKSFYINAVNGIGEVQKSK